MSSRIPPKLSELLGERSSRRDFLARASVLGVTGAALAGCTSPATDGQDTAVASGQGGAPGAATLNNANSKLDSAMHDIGGHASSATPEIAAAAARQGAHHPAALARAGGAGAHSRGHRGGGVDVRG